MGRAPHILTFWGFGVSVGSYLPASSFIRRERGTDTRARGSIALVAEGRQRVGDRLGIYGDCILAFGSVDFGSSVPGEPHQDSGKLVLGIGTAGVLLVGPRLSDSIETTLRLGAGFKGYRFALDGPGNQVRPTADVGLGVRWLRTGRMALTAEARWLPGTFDQGMLPTRGIVTQTQRQDDFMLTAGIDFRP